MRADAAFAHHWIAVGRTEDLPRPGAWFKAPLTPAGIVVVRGQDEVVRAFHAVCPHRGAAFIDDEEGRSDRFTCPYHGYGFELDGRACAKTADLAPVRLEIAHGFLFVNLDERAAPLEDAVPPWLARADLAKLRRARRVAYDVEAAWTIVVDNFQESLHFATVHPALEALTPSASAETWASPGPWLGGLMPLVPSAETVSISAKRRDRPWIAALEDRRAVHDAMHFPNLLTSLQPDYLLMFTLFPLGASRTRVIACTYVHDDAPEGDLEDVLAFWSRVYEEDRVACERQQRGVSSVPIAPAASPAFEGVTAFRDLLTPRAARLCGIFGKPYVRLEEVIDTSSFADLHREITRGLAEVETSYTGGTLKWMGVTAPWVNEDPYVDAMHAIRAMSDDDFAEFVSFGDSEAKRGDTFGDETDHPLTHAQMILLKTRFGVYFPWKVCYHLLENDLWEDKHSGEGKDFSDEARRVFPKTIAFIESLPMTEIGRVVVFGIEANDHAPAHRDSEPGKALAIAQSISFAPAGKKRFYVCAPDASNEVVIDAPIYWFNDADYHGVHADPWFRYSIRVDGVFDPGFIDVIRGIARRQ